MAIPALQPEWRLVLSEWRLVLCIRVEIALLGALDAFADGEQADDIAIVALRDRQTASRTLAA